VKKQSESISKIFGAERKNPFLSGETAFEKSDVFLRLAVTRCANDFYKKRKG
jgi:hypothetical protein